MVNLCGTDISVETVAVVSAIRINYTGGIPAYVFHATGAMKTMLDHFGYRWMPHRPAKEMFGKRAVIITQCLGAGGGSAAKDIKDSLSWWGVSSIRVCSFKLMSDIRWEKISENFSGSSSVSFASCRDNFRRDCKGV